MVMKELGMKIVSGLLGGLFDKKKPIGLTNLTTTAGGTLVGLAYYIMEEGGPEPVYYGLGIVGLVLMLMREWKK